VKIIENMIIPPKTMIIDFSTVKYEVHHLCTFKNIVKINHYSLIEQKSIISK